MAWHFIADFLERTGCGSSPSSPGPAAASSGGRSSAGLRSRRSRSTRSAVKCSCGGSGTACCRCSPSGTTCGRSTAGRGVAAWTSSLRGSPASPTLRPAGGPGPGTRGTSGRTPYVAFARWDPATRCWRTCLGFSRSPTSATSSGGWPRSGMMRNGTYFPLPRSAPRTSASGSGCLPTPVAYDATPGGPGNHYRGLGHRAKHGGLAGSLPTPRASDWGGQSLAATRKRLAEGGDVMLSSLIKWGERGLLPTPQRIDKDFCRSLPETVRRRAESGRQMHLSQVVMLPSLTPTCSDAEAAGEGWSSPSGGQSGGSQSSPGGTLNPDWVEWLMGFPTGWTALRPSGTRRFRRWLLSHSSCSPGGRG